MLRFLRNRKTLPVLIHDWMQKSVGPKMWTYERQPSKFDRCPTRTKLAHQSNLPLESGSWIDDQFQHSGERIQMVQWNFLSLDAIFYIQSIGWMETISASPWLGWWEGTITTQLNWRPTLMRQQASSLSPLLYIILQIWRSCSAAALCAIQSKCYI